MFSVTRRLAAATLVLGCLAAHAWAADAPRVKFTTSAGEFVVEVYPDKVPKTAENFLQYVRDKHYDGTVFHRVINNFMIQGGGYDVKMAEKKTRAPVQHEGRQGLQAGLRNTTGTLAMARTPDPDSASAQFFINVKDNAFLDPSLTGGDAGYTVFGRVVSGMDVVEKIKTVPTGNVAGHQNVPLTPVVIQSATIVK